MWAIVPTAPALTVTSHTGYTALGAGLGRLALGAILGLWVRRSMALLLVAYGVALGIGMPGRAA